MCSYGSTVGNGKGIRFREEGVQNGLGLFVGWFG